MFSHYTSRHMRSIATVLLSLGLIFITLWLLGGASFPALALPSGIGQPAASLAPNMILTVTNANDDGSGSLRQAIADANNGDIINFDNDYSIYLSSTLEITKQLTIDGGTYTVTVSGDSLNDGSRDVRVFFVTSTAVVTLNHINIVSGTALLYDGTDIYFGGGIYIHSGGQLTARNITLADSTAQLGGGIHNEGMLTLMNSVIIGNRAPLNGGAISNGGSTSLISATIMGNFATYNGGAISNNGLLTIANSVISNNISASGEGGGISTVGTVTLTHSTIVNNAATYGGGIANYGTVMMTKSTLASNVATYSGGGLFNYHFLTTTNSTFSSNLAQGSDEQFDGGGAIDQSGPSNTTPNALIENVTFANNNAPNVTERDGIWIERGGILLHNVLLADNGTNNCTIEAGAILTATADSMADDTTCVGATAVPSTSLILAPLADNGGSTWTMALLSGSPAIDTGYDGSCMPTDQRGVTRPQGSHCDIGAYELVADTRYVATTGNDSGNLCLDPINPCATVRHAVNVASDNNDIRIAAGIYTENITVTIPLNFVGVGTDGTIVDGNHVDRVFNIISSTVSIADLTIQNGSTASDGGGIYTNDILTLTQVTVANNMAYSGGGLYAKKAITLIGTNFISNTADSSVGRGGGVHAFGGPVNITEGQFVGNTAGTGGGLLVSGIATLTNVDFIRNTAHLAGGADVNQGMIDGGRFIENSSDMMAGGLGGGNFSITGTKFLSNTTVGIGGAIFAQDGTVMIMEADFENNYAGGAGGGLCVSGTDVTLSNTNFISNTSGGEGGGVRVGDGYAALISGGRFERNTATNGGGGIYTSYATVSGTDFISNTNSYDATIEGGGGAGLYASQSATITSARFAGNRCLFCEGGGLRARYQATVSYTEFADNTATDGGGGLATGILNLTNAQFISNTANNGGGVYLNGYTSPSRMVNALFAHNTSVNEGTALDLADGSTAVDILHATIVGSADNVGTAIRVGAGHTVHITNTIIANHAAGISNANGTVYEDYNLFYGNITNTIDVTSGGHSLVGDPKFVDPLLNDYHLHAGSAAIDHGVYAGIFNDLDSNPRPIGAGFDIGAYETPFVPSTYTLTMATTGNGVGTVTANPSGPSYLQGTVVTLTATPSVSSTFVGFSGDIVTPTPHITVTMDADKDITATFALKTFIITPTVGSGGSLTPAMPQTVNYGASATFTITANTDYHIAAVGVDGISQGPISLYTFDNITTHHTITATFAINTYTLTLNEAGNGIGSVISEPPGPSYTAGTVVTLTAIMSPTSRFMGWSGDVISTTNPLVMTMDSDKTVTATFVTHRVYLPLILR